MTSVKLWKCLAFNYQKHYEYRLAGWQKKGCCWIRNAGVKDSLKKINQQRDIKNIKAHDVYWEGLSKFKTFLI